MLEKFVGADKNSKDYRGNFTLEVTTTALCDLACTYCFEGEKTDKRRLDKDLPLIFKRIDEILADKDWFQKHYDRLNLSFWGGEPTLNPKFIVEIMNKYRDHEFVDFHIYTNGFNIKNLKRVLDNVDTTRLQVQFSYDGKPTNDKYRLTKNGKTTSDQVMDNFYQIARMGVSISLKSTLPIDNMETLSATWKDFETIQENLWQIDRRINVNFAPTIDYVTRMSTEEKDSSLVVFREQMLRIAKLEMGFYQKNNRHLCSWFGGEDNRKHCSAGLNMAAIDQAGDLFACHGAIYADKKTELQSTSISDDGFVGKLAAFSNQFAEPIKKIAKECVDCVATTCMICPVVSHDRSEKEEFFESWADNWANNLCGFFKTFGEIDRAVQKHQFQKKIDRQGIQRGQRGISV